MRDALVRIGGLPEPPLETIIPSASVSSRYRKKLEYSSRRPAGPVLGFHKAGSWEEVNRQSPEWAGHGARQPDPGGRRALGRESGHPAYDQEAGTGFLRHLVTEGAEHGAGPDQARDAPCPLDADGS